MQSSSKFQKTFSFSNQKADPTTHMELQKIWIAKKQEQS